MGCGVALTLIQNRHQINLQSQRINDNNCAFKSNTKAKNSNSDFQCSDQHILKVKIQSSDKPAIQKKLETNTARINASQTIQSDNNHRKIEQIQASSLKNAQNLRILEKNSRINYLSPQTDSKQGLKHSKQQQNTNPIKLPKMENDNTDKKGQENNVLKQKNQAFGDMKKEKTAQKDGKKHQQAQPKTLNTINEQLNKNEKSKEIKSLIPVEAMVPEEIVEKQAKKEGISREQTKNNQSNIRPESRQIKNGSGDAKTKNLIKVKQHVNEILHEQKVNEKNKSKIDTIPKKQEKKVKVSMQKKIQQQRAALQKEKKIQEMKKKFYQEEKKKLKKEASHLKQIYVLQ